MIGDPHVLILSTKLDVATDVVVRLLNGRGVRTTRFNTEDFPFDASLTAKLSDGLKGPSTSLTVPGIPVAHLDSVSSIWYRRVRSPEQPIQMSAGVYEFCLREARAALLGTVLSQRNRIMSPPSSIWAAEHKAFQLATAHAVGLSIPETVITNDAAEVRGAFKRFGGQMIAKPVRKGFVDYGNEQHAIFTTQVLESHLEELEDVRWSPAIYQPLIPKRYDVRATIVGSRVFVAEIDSQTDPAASIDWRHSSTSALPHQRAQLPPAICKALSRLFTSLGLTFGAVDLVRTPEDEYLFLEVNPNGQWLWLDDILELGISEAVADWLTEGVR